MLLEAAGVAALLLAAALAAHSAMVPAWQAAVGALALLGAVQVAELLFRALRFAYTQGWRQPVDLLERYGPGSWSVVTGASDGIGLGFAVELARRGFNVCLVSRTPEKLARAQEEVARANPSVRTRTVVTDFRFGSTRQYWDELFAQMGDLDISILVNNVGINYTETFTEIPEQMLLDIVNVNCLPQVMLSRKVINGMLARPRRSAIISLSSVAGLRPLLYLPAYCATKAFNDFFSRSLSLEFGDKLDIVSLRPGYVVSNMSKLTEKGGFVLDKYECAVGCLAKLGHIDATYGDPRHAVYAKSYYSLPEWILSERRKKRLEEKKKLR